MNFDLPPLNDISSNIPDLEVGELASAPSTSLMSLANSMGASLASLADTATQLKTRYDKIKGEISSLGSGSGRTVTDNVTSLVSIGTSIAASIGPVQSTAGIMGDIKDAGSDIVSNPTEAGTSDTEALSFTDKIGTYYDELTSGL